jgi:hypothetical protein
LARARPMPRQIQQVRRTRGRGTMAAAQHMLASGWPMASWGLMADKPAAQVWVTAQAADGQACLLPVLPEYCMQQSSLNDAHPHAAH